MKYAALIIILSPLLAAPVLACSPNPEFINLPFEYKISRPLFIGKVLNVVEPAFQQPGSVTFQVTVSGKNWFLPDTPQDLRQDKVSPAENTTITLPYYDLGTCGKFGFKSGEYWLYAGDNILSSATTLLNVYLIGNDAGQDLNAVIERIAGHSPLQSWSNQPVQPKRQP